MLRCFLLWLDLLPRASSLAVKQHVFCRLGLLQGVVAVCMRTTNTPKIPRVHRNDKDGTIQSGCCSTLSVGFVLYARLIQMKLDSGTCAFVRWVQQTWGWGFIAGETVLLALLFPPRRADGHWSSIGVRRVGLYAYGFARAVWWRALYGPGCFSSRMA